MPGGRSGVKLGSHPRKLKGDWKMMSGVPFLKEQINVSMVNPCKEGRKQRVGNYGGGGGVVASQPQ